MSIRISPQRQYQLSVALLFLAALVALVARADASDAPNAAQCALHPDESCRDAAVGDAVAVEPVIGLPHRLPRVFFVTGTVEPIETNFLGRTERVAIVTVTEEGVLVQNSVEDVAAGADLKDHLGQGVTARGMLVLTPSGTPSLLVDAFRVHGEDGGLHVSE